MIQSRVDLFRQRYELALERIAAASIRAGRQPDSVRLVVVTKAQPVDVVCDAIEAGARTLGENYAEEAVLKISALRNSGVEWHMIGHVQSRKAALVSEHFQVMQSLDSFKLAEKLDAHCGALGRQLPVLLEFNVSGEESKFGFPAWDESAWQDLLPVVASIRDLPNLKVTGLMTMPPFYDDPEKTRPFFRRLRSLREYLGRSFADLSLSELSMGTSIDYMAAVEEGATIVRIGTAIVGPRPA